MLTELLTDLRLLRDGRRPRVGVSACLLGRPVRYDGDHKYTSRVASVLAGVFEIAEACPEVGIGLPIPRQPIQVVRVAGEDRVRGVDRPDRDFTAALAGYTETLDAPPRGFILKARSPSCGLGDTPRHDTAGREIGLTDGAFAAALRRRFPTLPLCSEADLDDEWATAAFAVAVYCHWLGRPARDLPETWRQAAARFLR